MARDLQAGRTIVATILGAGLGAVALGAAAGYGLSAVLGASRAGQGLATLAAAIVAAAIGAVVGASMALALALPDDRPGVRRRTIIAVVVAGPPLCALVALAIGRTPLSAELDARHLLVVWSAVVLPVTALLGRWFALRRDHEDGST